jgi:uncharacterized protein (TIGR03083 family)
MPSHAPEPDYLDHLARESARFAAALRDVPSGAKVPPCPGWTADDLLWHLGEVQWFWGAIVGAGATTQAQVEELRPERPSDRAELREFYAATSRDLLQLLTAAAPDTPAWTWSDDQTVRFIRRRQAHEALIHRIDAELTADDRTPMDPRLSADGVDEALRIMYGGGPPWASFTPQSGQSVRITAADTGDSWFLTLGRFDGSDPDDQTSYDEPGMEIADSGLGSEAAATISGSAADLDCWIWHRPPTGPVGRAGDPAVLAALDSAIAPGIS